LYHQPTLRSLLILRRYGSAGSANASNAYRIFCFFTDNATVVLTHGFVKKSRKAPKNDIEKAEAYRRDFLKRRGKR